MLISSVAFIEISLLCAAAFLFFLKEGSPFAESASYAVMSVFMLLSFVRQMSFIFGIPVISTSTEVVFIAVSVFLIIRHRSCVPEISATLKNFESSNPLAFICLSICFLYMAIHTFLSVTKDFQTEFYTLSTLTGSPFFSSAAGSEPSFYLPMNHLILSRPLFQAGTDAGIGIFCFFAYLSIGFSTYALARRYAWPPTAFTSAVLVLSMPRLVALAVYPDCKIIFIAAALFCILAIYRSVEQPGPIDLVFLILGIFFSISENISSMIFAPILLILSCVVLFTRHGILQWKSIINKNRYVFFTVLPCVIFSQSWLFLSGYLNKDALFGAVSGISYNKDGIQGALANFIRYIFESFYFTAPLENFFKAGFKWRMEPNIISLYDSFVRPFIGESGAAQSFYLSWMQDSIFSVGPVGFFLVLPALIYAVLKGPRRLKAVAAGFFVYFYLVCLIMAWAPDNTAFFDIFYVCAGFSIAFFLPPWRFTKKGNMIFQAGGCFLLILTLCFTSGL